MSKVIFRIEKLKSWGEIGAAASHNLRTRETPGAGGSQGFIEVLPLSGSAVYAVRAAIGEQTIRKNAVLAVEAIISASPEYFRPDAPGRAGHWDEDKLQAWRDKIEPWIAKKFPHAISVVLHLDESTPHYQIIDVPLDKTGKLNCRAKYGGKEILVEWQDDAARAVSSLGIERGIAGSAAKHERIQAYYAAINRPSPAIPDVKTPRPEQLPPRSISEQIPFAKAKNDRDELERNHASQTAKRNEERSIKQQAINQAYSSAEKKAKAVDLAQKKQREAEATATKLATLKTDSEKLRALSLDQVLKRVYSAELEKGSREAHASRKYRLPDGREIAVSAGENGADVWIEQGGIGRRGAINLVMQLDALQYRNAVRLLAEHFDVSSLSREHSRTLVDRAPDDIKKISADPVPAPDRDATRWPKVKKWLHEVRGIPKKLIDSLYEQGLVYADSRGNATFKRVHGGAFQRGTGSTKFHRAIGGADCGPFLVPGTSKTVVLCEGALDGIAVMATRPAATIIASGGDMLPPGSLKKWIPEGSEILAAHDADARGEKVAKDAAERLGAKRMKPNEKDWAATVLREPWRIDASWLDPDTGSDGKTPLKLPKPA